MDLWKTPSVRRIETDVSCGWIKTHVEILRGSVAFRTCRFLDWRKSLKVAGACGFDVSL